jgi:hypothetical protein
MAGVLAECVRKPGLKSVWSERHRRYICEDHPEFETAMAEQSVAISRGRSPLSSSFKLVFLTSVGGTVLFTGICVATSLLAGREPPPLMLELVRWAGDLAKIGFGAIVGILGGQALRG